MRVATLNLWGRGGAWDERRRVLAEGLRELQPDLVAFQEAIRTDDYDEIADLLGSGFHVVHQAEREPDGQGASIASRWPVGDVRGQLNFEYEREQQALIAARAVEELVEGRGVHVVMAGDFTAGPDSASVRFLTGRQSLDGVGVCYRDAWESANPGDPGETFTPRNPLVFDWDWPYRRLDYILVRCGEHGGPTLAISACAHIFDEPVDGVWASDHFGVVADLDVPPADR